LPEFASGWFLAVWTFAIAAAWVVGEVWNALKLDFGRPAGEYAGRRLRVVTVSPGPTATPLWLGPHGAAAQRAALEGGDAASIAQAAGERMPHRRFVKAEEVADLIAFLASPRAASLSGIDILIDAGLTQTL
jgi:NAD(P)-dependent dehydrogenase (short-subunit alcohol dehydrogenase family)